jgi:hypothetical protein
MTTSYSAWAKTGEVSSRIKYKNSTQVRKRFMAIVEFNMKGGAGQSYSVRYILISVQ